MKTRSNYIFKKIKLFWVLITLCILLASFFINWQLNLKRAYKDLSYEAKTIANNLDGVIEDILQSVYTLPVYGKKFPECRTSLHKDLERILVNTSTISGLEINDNRHHLICSTLVNYDPFHSDNNRPRVILGPTKLALFDQPIYLIQQKLGDYYIGVIILSSILEHVLETHNIISNSIALLSNYDKKNLIQVEHGEHEAGWKPLYGANSKSLNKTDLISASEKIQSIDGVVVTVYENHKVVLEELWISQAILSFVVLLTSSLLYLILKNELNKHYSLPGAMKIALKNKDFYPAYQPIFDDELKVYCGAEILLRWKQEHAEPIMPDLFIMEAETTGLIVPITLNIIETAFKEIKPVFSALPEFYLAINLCALHFKSPTFFDEFHELAKKYQVKPKQIIFELTERDLINQNDAIFVNTMQELRQAGYSLAVDDYGTGHASISYLQNFPFNYLKIDKQFIQAIGTKAITESLNDAIIQMAKKLHLFIVAEGVESEEQKNYLTKSGVRYLQGWYFSKALSIDGLKSLLHL